MAFCQPVGWMEINQITIEMYNNWVIAFRINDKNEDETENAK